MQHRFSRHVLANESRHQIASSLIVKVERLFCAVNKNVNVAVLIDPYDSAWIDLRHSSFLSRVHPDRVRRLTEVRLRKIGTVEDFHENDACRSRSRRCRGLSTHLKGKHKEAVATMGHIAGTREAANIMTQDRGKGEPQGLTAT